MVAGRGYRAGVAYVEVLPVLGGSQKTISRDLRKMLNDKQAFNGIKEAIRDEIVKGAREAGDDVRDHVEKHAEKMAKNIASDIKKNGKLSVTEIERQKNASAKAARDSAGAWRTEMLKATKEIDKHLGALGKGRDARGRSVFGDHLTEARKQINSIMDVIDGRTKMSDANLRRTYQSLSSIVRRMHELQPGRNVASDTDLFNVKNAVDSIDKYFNAIERQMTKREVDEENRRAKAAEDSIKAENAAREKAANDAIKAEKARWDAAQAKRDEAYAESLAKDKKRADQREKYRKDLIRAEDKWAADELARARTAEERHQKMLDIAHTEAIREQKARNAEAKREKKRRADIHQRMINNAHTQALTEERRRAADRKRVAAEQKAADEAEKEARLQRIADQKEADRKDIARREKFFADTRAVNRRHRRLSGEDLASYDDTMRTRMDQTPKLGHERTGINRRQEAAIGRQRREVARLQSEIQSTMSMLTTLGSVRPTITMSTGKAESDLRELQRKLAQFQSERYTKEIKVDIDQDGLMREVARVKATAESIEDIDLEVDVDDEEAQAKIAALRAYLQQLKQDDYRVLVDVDAEGLNDVRRELTRLTTEVHDLNLSVEDEEARASVKRLDQAIDAIDGKTVGVDITEQRARANIAIIRQELERLDRMDVDVHVDVEFRKSALDQIRQFEAQMGRGGERMRSLNRSIKNAGISLTETTQAFRIFNPVLAAVAFVGAPVVSTLGGVAAGLGAITSAAPGVIGGAVLPLTAAFWGLGDAMENYEKYQESVAIKEDDRTKAQQAHIDAWKNQSEAMGEATLAWMEYTSEFMPRLAGMQNAAREGLFPGLMESIDELFVYEQPLTDFLGVTAEMLGEVAKRWSGMLTSGSAKNWFSRVAEDAQLYMPAILQATENIIAGFANLVDAFRPFAREFMSWLINMTGRWKDWTASLSGSDKFVDFLDSVRSTLPGIGDASKGILELFANLVIAVEPFTLAIMDAVNSALDFINALDPSTLSAILGAVGGLVGGMMLLSGVMAGVGAVAAVLKAATGSLLTGIATGLATLIATSSAALGASVALEGGVDGLWGSALSLVDGLDEVSNVTVTVMGFFGHLFDAISPLLPAIFDLTELLISLVSSGVDFLADALTPLVGVLGWVVDLFSAFPTEVQGAVLALAILLPNLNKIRGAFDTAFIYADDFFKVIGKGGKNLKRNVLGVLSTLGEVVLGVGETLIGGATHMATFGTNAKTASRNVGAVSTRLVGLAGGVVGIVALTGAWMIYNDAQERASDRVEIFDAKMQGLDTTILNSAEGVDQMRSALDGLFTADNALWNDIENMDEAMQRLGNDKWWMPITMLNNAFAGLGETMEGADQSLLTMIESGNIEGAVLMYDEMAAAAARNDVAHEDFNDRLPDFITKLQSINAELGGVVDEEELLAELREGRIPEALVNAIEASDEYGGAVEGVKDELSEAEQATRDLMDATDEMTGRNLTQAEAQTRYGEAVREFKEKLAEAKHGMDEFTEVGTENRKMFEDLAQETRNKADADLEATGNAADYAELLWDSRDAMAAHMEDLGLTKDEALDLSNAYHEIPDWVETEADLITYAANIAETDDVLEQMGKIDGYDAHPSAMLDDEASPDIKKVEGKLDDLDGEVATPKANLEDNVTGALELPQNKLDEFQDTYTATVNVTANDPYGILFKRGPGKSPGPWADGLIPHHDGAILEHFAKGGLKPMDPVAQMVRPNTWRVVGDRMKDDEAYIPLDGSSRSKEILFQAIERMPGLFMEKGGLLKAFATGGVASPAAGGAEAEAGAEGGEMAAVSEAFLALDAALRSGFTVLLTDLLGMSQGFFAQLMVAHLAFNEQALAASALFNEQALAASALFRETETAADADWQAQMVEALATHLTGEASAAADHRASELGAESAQQGALAQLWADHRSTELGATSTYLSELISREQSAQSTMLGNWQRAFSDIRTEGNTFRSDELSDMHGFHNENARMITSFGTGARTEWSRIWRDLRDNAKSIFGDVPGDVGGILVDVSKKLNEHIVSPFNKIIKDLDLKKIDPLSEFPTQSHATGGHVALRSGGFMPGYTPGRDVHTFTSPTGGVLELSGGEPVLRPEVGAVLGRDWVDSVNAAARNGGINGVKNMLGGQRQAFASGGVWQNLWGIVHEQFPNARLTSWVRNGSGGSYHNTGRAIDVAGPAPGDVAFMKRIYEFIHDNYGNTSELIFTPGGGKNILNGRYHTYSPAVRANHRDHVHWANTHRFSDVVGPPPGGSAMGLYDITGNMDSWISNARKAMDDGFIQDTAMESYAGLFSEVAKQKQDAFITDHSHLINDPGGPGGGVGRWRSMVNMALEHMGQPTTEAMQNIVLRRMRQESNGNPRAINLWDSNARRGTPSKGLMQVIDPTFQANRDRSLVNDIWDPMANIVASMRYALGRYGSLPAAYNRKGGYALGTAGINLADLFGDSGAGSPLPGGIQPLLRDRGGAVPTGYSVVQNNTGHEETILPATPQEVERLLGGGGLGQQTVDNSVHFDNVRFEGDPEQMYETAMRRQRVAAINRPMKI